MHKLSVVIITLNEEDNIARCLTSATPLANEVIVVDGLSTDNTADICNSFGCKVILREFKGYSDQKQFAVDQTSNDWVLVLDADEELTVELRNEISALLMKEAIPHNGYKIPRALFYLGKILRFSGVGDKPVLRLFNKQMGRFNGAPVHEEILVEGGVGLLKSRMIHYSYSNLFQHIQKINTYTSHAGNEYRKKGKRFNKFYVALKFPLSFFILYLLRGGFLDGYPGFWWSLMAAFNSSVKYAKAIEPNIKRNSN